MKGLALDVFPIERRYLRLKHVYFFFVAWLIDYFEDTGADLCTNVGENVIGLEGLNNKVFKFVELLHFVLNF